MMDIDKTYEKQHIRNIIKRNQKIERILTQAQKDITNRISRFRIRHPETEYIGSFYRFNRPMERKIDDMLKILHLDMTSNIEDGMVQGWEMSNTKNSALVDKYLKGILPAEPTLLKSMHQLNIGAMNSFINRTEKGMNLSNRVWRILDDPKDLLGMKQQLETYMASGIMTGKSAAEISRDVRDLLREPKRLFRRVREDGKLKLSKSAKMYNPGKGVYRSAFKNALRLTATETNMAYRTGDFMRRQQLPFVMGIEIHLSADHDIFDMCDSLQGEYPKGFVFGGWHPRCICFSTSIMLKREVFVNYMQTGKIARTRYKRVIPRKATNWVNRNKAAINRWENKPYFIRDNFTQDFKLRKDAILGGEKRVESFVNGLKSKKSVSKVA